MTDKEFIELFRRQKEAFLKKYEKGTPHDSLENASSNGEHKRVLDWFERWLREERVVVPEEDKSELAKTFDQFTDEVLTLTQEMLAEKGIKITYTLPGQRLGVSESWKCIKVFGNKNIYYRIGRTRPRKGPHKGQELLVLDLVMDGYKKQVFIPLLNKKEDIERQLGEVLERELPKVEATGKYRLKLLLPLNKVKQEDTSFIAKKLADFIMVTKPVLNKLGVV